MQQPYPAAAQQHDPNAVRLADRPADHAEEVFQDDPEMLALIAKNRARQDPVRKPWWWLALEAVAMVAGAGVMAAVALLLTGGKVPDPLVPLTGMAAGGAAFLGLVGFRPGHYIEVMTQKRAILWVPIGTLERLGWIVGAVIAAPLGLVISWFG